MPDFPSGQWVGFYTYPGSDQRFLMDLILEFKGGLVSGDGADGIGEFGIDGHYWQDEGECDWIKTYVGKHSVEYRGFREKKGIWGTWNIRKVSGGFHIWPIGQGTEELVGVAEIDLALPSILEFSPRPNQALEPTRPAVTPFACAKVAPAGRVAHL